MIGWSLGAVAFAGALVVHQRIPWIPAWYLALLIVLPAVVWWSATCRIRGTLWRCLAAGLAGAAFIALWPVPWMKAQLDHPPGTAWQIDRQLEIEGNVVDPPGDWYWLTAGRPPVVGELVGSWLLGNDDAATSLRSGGRAQRPVFVEPAAASVGLRRAGWAIEFGVMVEVSQPTLADLPGRALLASINGSELTDRPSWETAVGGLTDLNTLTTAAGDTFEFLGAAMPFQRVDVIDRPSGGIDVMLGGPFAKTLPGKWFRNLSVGGSDGMMIALVSYVHASGDDLAAGRTIAGTGGIRGDGTVRRISGLWSKATAARDIGADVLLFPAAQADDLVRFDAGSMQLVSVATLDDAIAALASDASA